MHSPKQRRQLDAYGRNLAAVTRGAVLLGAGADNKIRNKDTGRIFPCCWTDCVVDADRRYYVEVPHETPRWIDPTTGKQEMVVYTFCSEAHKEFWLAGIPRS